MKSVGYKERYESYKRKKNLFLILIFSSCLFLIADIVVFLLLATYENINKAYFINLPVFLIISLLFTYFLVNEIHFVKELKFLKHLFTQYINEIEGEVIDISDEEMASKGRKTISITVMDEEGKVVVYYESNFGEPPFKVNDKVVIQVVDSFILEYEVKENENI